MLYDARYRQSCEKTCPSSQMRLLVVRYLSDLARAPATSVKSPYYPIEEIVGKRYCYDKESRKNGAKWYYSEYVIEVCRDTTMLHKGR